jgi:16S rRNA (adenine1518-N6/adenine1519-N6)-dimethyltransferase
MGDPVDLRSVLRQFDIQPKKSLGQNFLFDPAVLDRIVRAGDVGPTDTVLEIGPGAGSLTLALAQSAARVVAVELDDRLLPVLAHTTGNVPNITILHGDILKTDLQALIDTQTITSYKVVANIPYYITSAVIRHLLEAAVKPSLIVLTVQREVAQRICAQPPEMSLLAVSVQAYGQPRLAGQIPAGAFYPAPDVDSAIVRIDLFEQPLITPAEADKFFEVVKAGFSQKRKQIRNALAGGLGLKNSEAEALLIKAGLDPSRRAETLTIPEWVMLYKQTL